VTPALSADKFGEEILETGTNSYRLADTREPGL